MESDFDVYLDAEGRFSVGAFGRNLVSVAVKMSSHLNKFKKKYCIFCNFNGIFKENATTDCINVQHEKVSFLSNLMGRTLS